MSAIAAKIQSWTWRHWVVAACLAGVVVLAVYIVGTNLWYNFGPGSAERLALIDCWSGFSAVQEMELVELGTDSIEVCEQDLAEDPEAFLATYGD
jgi:hypothetical protein